MSVWNAVVAATTSISEQYRDAFDLGREAWDALGHAAATTGRPYHRIVVLRPHWRTTAAEIAAFEEAINSHWRTRLAIGGELKIL
jgi:hypothetical protein